MLRKTLIAMTATAALSVPALADGHSKNIVETAAAAGDFGTLLAAAEAAGLVETLTSEGPFTVFAPTDTAFAALPEGTVDTLLLPENKDQLTSILLYHVVPGKVMSTDLSDGLEAPTALEGQSVTVSMGDTVMIGDATVVAADVEASNGVIHVIDAVLLPAS
ncbi:fasciclin domain-containing protein [Jannaschia sp. M317]|uniref:fasciclin domain-containing protein n=1 Tax=Jannaschia sp. M317 TaxID=2867011 RepID=UPI0021A8B1CD|nr:fasciclin domain-containing protein [Jannaschia sp. M317]UWQ18534.1 fasciclin domain-containing protein [Jannaschia sp. M317]